MNSFFDYIQPTIVKTSNEEDLPENLRNRYFVNFNTIGIEYFIKSYLLSENESGAAFLLLKEDNWEFELEGSDPGDPIDIPRIYIMISDKFISDSIDSGKNTFMSFVIQALKVPSIWATGTDEWVPGVDYFLNYTLYNYLANTDQIEVPNFASRLPNYIDKHANISKYWQDLSNEPYADYVNVSYFNEKNKLLDNHFSEDELNNFYSTFANTILSDTQISDELRASGNNPIYEMVLKYYAAFQNDEASTGIALILNTLYASSTSSTGCGCNSSFSEKTYNTASCYDLYRTAMLTYLKQMLGDAEFYKDWFYIRPTENDMLTNEVLISKINTLIEEFKEMGNVLSFVQTKSYNCSCPTVTVNDNECNYDKIENYKKVLNYISNCEVEANINKIKVWGGQFAEILPSLQF